MIRFLFKGIIRDRGRSLLPVIVVSIGVMLTVFLNCWLTGIFGESIEMNARFNTGHVKVMTRAYAQNADQIPNDLALLKVNVLMKELKSDFPILEWVERIRFGGLIDFPDEKGETRIQGPVAGWAIDLLSGNSKEMERFNINKSIVEGHLPFKNEEALISIDFAKKFKIRTGDKFTFFGSTMDGSMAFKNFTVAGIVRFGTTMLDRGAIIMDISDARLALNMDDAAGEILGFFNDGIYHNDRAIAITDLFNQKYKNEQDEFAPLMVKLRDQSGMAEYLDYAQSMGSIMVVIFIIGMSVVLWNAGLLGGLRRYTEFGLRLAMGEEKKHIYKTLIYEGLLIGTIGSITGTCIGLAISYYIQITGIDMGEIMKNSSLMMPSVVRAIVTPSAFYIGFIPGLFSTVLGNSLAGIGIYKRNTAKLFKELEV